MNWLVLDHVCIKCDRIIQGIDVQPRSICLPTSMEFDVESS